MLPMSVLSHEEATRLLSPDPQALDNESFRHRFETAASFESITFDSFDSFSKLIWHFSPFSRVLTPPHWWGGGKLYTVGDVAKKMISEGWTFSALAKGEIAGTYKPGWFESCETVYNAFDYEKCLPLVVLNAGFSEKWDCSKSQYRIIDGIHRSLVIAYKVYANELLYQRINGIVLHEKKR